MNGPAHYREAERLVKGRPVDDRDRADGIGPKSGFWAPSEMELRLAQVHATLAAAAATAASISNVGVTDDEAVSWHYTIEEEGRA